VDCALGTKDDDVGFLGHKDGCAEKSLPTLERTTLEYFLAFIRLRSRKQLRWWSMLSPLGFYSKGFQQPGQKSHLNAASCQIRVAWKHCNELFERCRADRMALIEQQFTCSLVFDNWQRCIQKLWQTEGKSSIMQKGTAYLIKRDKCFVLPEKSIMMSPSGI